MIRVEEIIGALVEAWAELRVHRTRVLLSLIGVAVATCSLTSVLAAGEILGRANVQQVERSNGRPATYSFSVSVPQSDTERSSATLNADWNLVMDAYKVRYWSRVSSGRTLGTFPSGRQMIDITYVDQPYAAIHKLQVVAGSWFGPGDAGRMTPAVVVNDVMWQALGSPSPESHPTVRIGTHTALVLGVTDAVPGDLAPSMFVLPEAQTLLSASTDADRGQGANYEVWLPEQTAPSLAARLSEALGTKFGPDARVYDERQDLVAERADATKNLQFLVIMVSVLVLLLGALSLVNIAIITLRQRIREIGVRRSFGASTQRIFFSIMLESTLGTAIAGLVGVALAFLVLTNPIVLGALTRDQAGVDSRFPLYTAMIGELSSLTIGAVSGFVPAVIAVRIRVIDAIRF